MTKFEVIPISAELKAVCIEHAVLIRSYNLTSRSRDKLAEVLNKLATGQWKVINNNTHKED